MADYHTEGISEEFLSDAHKVILADAKNYLAKIAANLKREGIAVKTVIAEGVPSDKIIDYADNNQVDLIIMNTHGRSGVARWTIGSVADKVMRNSTASVLMVSSHSRRV
jgi:nucleotide-binding universal stress UspA family protein